MKEREKGINDEKSGFFLLIILDAAIIKFALRRKNCKKKRFIERFSQSFHPSTNLFYTINPDKLQ
jgi:hypothetical protein